jgi:hypothetical protein
MEIGCLGWRDNGIVDCDLAIIRPRQGPKGSIALREQDKCLEIRTNIY